MLNEQHKDEAMEEKVLKECRGGVKASLLQLSLLFLSVAVFPVLLFLFSSVLEVESRHQVQTQARDFPLAPPQRN